MTSWQNRFSQLKVKKKKRVKKIVLKIYEIRSKDKRMTCRVIRNREKECRRHDNLVFMVSGSIST